MDLPGWLIAASRAAAGFGYRELGEAANVSTAWLIKVERLPVITARAKAGRGQEGIDGPTVLRLLATFKRCGLELRGAAGGHPAMLVCVDPVALGAIRDANGKGAGEAD